MYRYNHAASFAGINPKVLWPSVTLAWSNMAMENDHRQAVHVIEQGFSVCHAKIPRNFEGPALCCSLCLRRYKRFTDSPTVPPFLNIFKPRWFLMVIDGSWSLIIINAGDWYQYQKLMLVVDSVTHVHFGYWWLLMLRFPQKVPIHQLGWTWIQTVDLGAGPMDQPNRQSRKTSRKYQQLVWCTRGYDQPTTWPYHQGISMARCNYWQTKVDWP